MSQQSRDQPLGPAERLSVLVIQHVVSELPGLPQTIRDACRQAQTREDAGQAAEAAWEALVLRAETPQAGLIVEIAREAGWATHATEPEWMAGRALRAVRLASTVIGGDETSIRRLFEETCRLWIRHLDGLDTEGLGC